MSNNLKTFIKIIKTQRFIHHSESRRPGMLHWQSIVGNVRAGAGQSSHQSCSESSNLGPLSEVLLAAMQPRRPVCAPSGLTPPAGLRTWFENAGLEKGEFSSRTLSSALIQCS